MGKASRLKKQRKGFEPRIKQSKTKSCQVKPTQASAKPDLLPDFGVILADYPEIPAIKLEVRAYQDLLIMYYESMERVSISLTPLHSSMSPGVGPVTPVVLTIEVPFSGPEPEGKKYAQSLLNRLQTEGLMLRAAPEWSYVTNLTNEKVIPLTLAE